MNNYTGYEGRTEITSNLWKIDMEGDINITVNDIDTVIYLTKEDLERMLGCIKYHTGE